MSRAVLCPSCRKPWIVVQTMVLCLVEEVGPQDRHGATFFGYGGGRTIVNESDQAFCNSVGCGWHGNLRDAMTTEESNDV